MSNILLCVHNEKKQQPSKCPFFKKKHCFPFFLKDVIYLLFLFFY